MWLQGVKHALAEVAMGERRPGAALEEPTGFPLPDEEQKHVMASCARRRDLTRCQYLARGIVGGGDEDTHRRQATVLAAERSRPATPRDVLEV